MNNIVKFKNVKVSFKNVDFFNNLNIEFPKEKMIAIIGKSGAGKTTLVNCILKGTHYQAGEIYLFGENIKTTKNKWKNLISKVAYITQEPNLIQTDSVYNNIKRSFRNYDNWFYKIFNLLSKKEEEFIFQTLNKLNILQKAFERVENLSGGEKQRVEICKAIVQKCQLLIADEPTSNLDYETSQIVMQDIKKVNESENLSVLVIIHDLKLAYQYFEYFLIVKNQNISLVKKEELTFEQLVKLI
ncbi:MULTISPECIES: ATP-binding cassette domain-containing protein [unclassified Mycoplasma]|uniref:ATP-binding cassette domain-containing protein n=1 Tax=unclassified Mycoplasma TaxID=2683645 RepID=UPI00211D0472|nr:MULTISPECIES: ATP-binding cassette domain-containing protein [unclassified Mycoplasma]UUM19807.1 ATP-binding cassette domain-containing protein [Mycoplasma sp. 1578d]UUM24791.1 ATP-binding cassette domain-containing protein [Mycoplasma sp. 3686d]